MSGNGNAGTGITVLKVVAVFAVVAAGVGLGIVALKHGSKGGNSTPGDTSSDPSAVVRTGDSTQASGTASGRSATSATGTQTSKRSTTGNSLASGGQAGTTGTSLTTTQTTGRTSQTRTPTGTTGNQDTSSTRTNERRTTTGSGTSSGDAKAEAETDTEATEPLVADKAVAYVPPVWDETSGELLIGNQRYLTKLGTLQRLNLNRDEMRTVMSLKQTMRTRVDFQLKNIDEEIQQAVKTYEEAVAKGDKEQAENYHHMVTKHLIPDRQTILDTVNVQLDELLQEAMPGR
ncbi:MAG: hypothetical protein JXL80_13995 [Planctomycetes bacterium]|nr:hypothetical protein [Planctomycetota bacterium]